MKALVCLTIGVGIVLSDVAQADDVIRAIYYNKEGNIYRVNPAWTNPVLIRSAASLVKVYSAGNEIYWRSGNAIRKSNLAGVGNEDVTDLTGIFKFDIDPVAEYLYFLSGSGQDSLLKRRDLKNGQEETIIRSRRSEGLEPGWLALLDGDLRVDPQRKRAYVAWLAAWSVDLDSVNQTSAELELVDGLAARVAPEQSGRFVFTWDSHLEFPEEIGPAVVSELSIDRTDLDTSQVVSSSFDQSGFLRVWVDQMGGYPYAVNVYPSPGGEEIYLRAQDLAGHYGLYRTNFPDGDPVKVDDNAGNIQFDLVNESGYVPDTEDPVVTLFSPKPGTTNNQFISLAGEATDNTSVTSSIAWSLNGIDQESMSVLADGSFSASGITLELGENILSVIVNDLYGNQTVTDVTVTWLPDRQVSLGDPLNTTEGQLVTIPVSLFSGGDVSGMTVEINYEARDLKSLIFEPAAALEGAAVTSNLTSPGTSTLTFAKPETTVLAGDQVLGNLTFRTRSVADDLTTALTVNILDVSDSDGTPIVIGNTSTGTQVTIAQREFIADVNTNGRLDIGDAFLMQQLLAGLEEKRTWDDTLNDLNESGTLDSGDVVRVLRTVLGILPQPESPLPILALSSGAIAEESGPKATLIIDDVAPSTGDTITVRIMVDDLEADIGGVSFAVDYPVDALRLEDAGSHSSGSLVSGGVLVLWNVAPTNDFANQTGTVSFAATGSSTWPGSAAGGEVGVLTFRVTDDIATMPSWPITLRNVELTKGGYSVDTPSGDSQPIVGQPKTFQSWAATQFTVGQLADSNISGWAADPDGDGNSNGQEYFQGSSAILGDGQSLTGAVYLTGSGEEIPLIKLQRAITHQAVDYQLQMSTNLDDWTDTDSQVYLRTLTGDNSTENLYIGPPDPPALSDRIFLRLIFTNMDSQF